MRLVRYQARQSPRKLQSGVGGELAGRAGPSERLQITGFYALCESVNGLRWPCPPQERRYNSVSAHKPQFRIRTLLGRPSGREQEPMKQQLLKFQHPGPSNSEMRRI
jgi:hypothetical protein